MSETKAAGQATTKNIPQMQTRYDVHLWEPELSPHKLPLFQALLGHPRIASATYIAEGELNHHRTLQGWQVDVGQQLPIIIAPTAAQVDSIIERSPPNSVHIFSGMHWVPCIVNGIQAAIRHRRRFGILHEPRVFEGLGGLARLGHSWLTEAALRRNASFILAIGAHGPSWFQMSGFPKSRIFPFAYFLSNRAASEASFKIMKTQRPVVSFLGRLEKLKGIHLFLDSMDKIESEADFYVAGYGSWSSRVEDARRSHPNLHHLGAIKMEEVPYLLVNTDILVLPSITMDDGWGAVISEGLMAGAAIVCSYKVGASMCLADSKRGQVVGRLAGAEVAKAVDRIINEGLLDVRYREARAQWADTHLTHRVGLDYLLDIFDHVFDGKARPRSFVAEHD
ncbi:glycosyltransferase involved in cell wall biosynthesis [Bradyrhizobium sp. CIR18]|uniref:glycosyltransferase n=1 Tax=Bradyrhizobium sp. CIR18 TaxID=2663839 RepID=UPI001606006E|nr:glycosyltransferase [Bradyrhizobium sp. CIR18]MBB4365101.1 glycosyltransferase involved in cell wall biosynthesis [Bradyrhizobium sp. CIR18]